jgi:hypothetical protein
MTGGKHSWRRSTRLKLVSPPLVVAPARLPWLLKTRALDKQEGK